MATLNKTQLELINRARKHGGAASVVAGSGRGAYGGRVSFGSRERAAMFKLADMGLVKVTHRDTDREFNRGNCVHSTSFRYELVGPTDEQFSAALGPCGK